MWGWPPVYKLIKRLCRSPDEVTVGRNQLLCQSRPCVLAPCSICLNYARCGTIRYEGTICHTVLWSNMGRKAGMVFLAR